MAGGQTLTRPEQLPQLLLKEWESIRGDRGLTGVDHAGHLTGAALAAIVWQIGYG